MNAFHSQPPHDADDPSHLAHAVAAADEHHDAADHLAVLGMLQLRGEQPADAALSRRLQADAGLRDESHALAEIDGMLRGMVARSDGGAVSSATSDRALQASLRMMREQALVRRQNGGASRRHRRTLPNMPRWAWATAAAAAIAIGFAFWSAGTDPDMQLAKLMPGVADNTDTGSVGNGGGGSSLDSDNASEIQRQIDALNFIAQSGDTGDANGVDADPSANDPN